MFNSIQVPYPSIILGQSLHNTSGTDKFLGWVRLDYCVVTSRDTIDVCIYPRPLKSPLTVLIYWQNSLFLRISCAEMCLCILIIKNTEDTENRGCFDLGTQESLVKEMFSFLSIDVGLSVFADRPAGSVFQGLYLMDL